MELLQLLVNYLLSAGNIDDINGFIQASTERVSGPVRSEIVTAAEKLKDIGRQECAEKIALTMLQEGAEVAFVAKVTGLPESDIKRLQASLKNQP